MDVVQWRTQSCAYSWSLRSAWGVYDDKTQLTACTRTQTGTGNRLAKLPGLTFVLPGWLLVCDVCGARAGSVYATSDWFGRVRLWRHPVCGPEPAFVEAR